MPRRSPARPVSPLDAHLGFWLRIVSNQVSGSFRQAVEAAGVSVSDWVALRHLYGGAETTPAALVDALGMTRGAVSKILARLEARGLLERARDDADARVQRLALTAAGAALVPRLAALADANDARFFGHLPAAERTRLQRLLRDIARRHGLTRMPLD